MADSKSPIQRNSLATWIALAVWLAISLILQALFIDSNERLDAGAILVAGAAPILIVSSIHLMTISGYSRGVVIFRVIMAIVCGALALGELTDLDKDKTWQVALPVIGLILVLYFLLWRKKAA
ncbi:hypothetical protein [Dehalogenimonas alkenigignens]|uniref:hypothetical protein n=1 Tax=Dehalogenimonas alkenigignens TaxID=1217799 RepID=UPI000D5721A8|nr:hypothetical protein [Dehalogenimonas alkenigignens]PVV83284.1 hypothetical protein DD509_06840 [Dehalogenimonas alkenigignens]